MKRNLVLTIILFFSLATYAQDFEYRKDENTQNKKADRFDMYQLDKITTYNLLKALELAGVRVHKLTLPEFDAKQQIKIEIDEYVNGELVNSKNVFNAGNTYFHFTDSIINNDLMPYIDYIDCIDFYTKETGDEVEMRIATHMQTAKPTLKLKYERERQYYNWRRYNTINWKLGEKIPFLVFASSWHDGKVERFCGVADLSDDKMATQELLDSSTHYFIFNCTIGK